MDLHLQGFGIFNSLVTFVFKGREGISLPARRILGFSTVRNILPPYSPKSFTIEVFRVVYEVGRDSSTSSYGVQLRYLRISAIQFLQVYEQRSESFRIFFETLIKNLLIELLQ